MLVLSKGERATDAEAALEASYGKGVCDEFVLPTVITENDKPVAAIEDGDVVIFFNYRSDRPRELTRAFTEEGFNAFSLKGKARKVTWVTMTRYDEAFKTSASLSILSSCRRLWGRCLLKTAENNCALPKRKNTPT